MVSFILSYSLLAHYKLFLLTYLHYKVSLIEFIPFIAKRKRKRKGVSLSSSSGETQQGNQLIAQDVD